MTTTSTEATAELSTETGHVLVRLENGAVKSFPVDHPAVAAEGVEIIRDSDGSFVEGLDEHGMPIETYHPEVADADLEDDVATAEGYHALNVTALKAEIDSRNAGAEPGVEPISKSGNKDALVAALEGDDLRRAQSGVQNDPPDAGAAGSTTTED